MMFQSPPGESGIPGGPTAQVLLPGLLSVLSEGMVVHDALGVIVEANASAERLLGLSADQLRGRTPFDPRWAAVREDGSPLPGDEHPAMVSLRTGQTVQNWIMGINAPQFGQRWISVNSTPLMDPTGSAVMGAVATFVDVTERRLLQTMPFGFHSLDASGKFRDINATALSWIGYERDEVIGKMGPTDFFTDEGKAVFARNFPLLVARGELKDMEFELLHRNGSSRRVRVNASVVRDSTGRYLRSRSFMFDVTEVRRLEAKAHSMLREQNAMLDNDLVGIVKIQNRQAIWANRAMHRIFGYEADELMAQPARIIYPNDESFREFGEVAYPILMAGKTFRNQQEFVRKDGSKIWCDISGDLLSASTGESMWLLSDITAMKEHQRELERLALHDVLTDLPNRELLGSQLEKALAMQVRDGGLIAVCYLDLDGFKPVNDQFGHAAGDRLLKVVGQRLLSLVRPNDTVARIGGDEFVVVLTQLAGESDLPAILDRMTNELQQPIQLDDGVEASVGASIGVAVSPIDAKEKGLLIRLADHAMYIAKGEGRRHWVRATPHPEPSSQTPTVSDRGA